MTVGGDAANMCKIPLFLKFEIVALALALSLSRQDLIYYPEIYFAQ